MKNIVIGSGPAGRLGSYELGRLGENVTLIEKNHIAGTCLNEGCMVVCALTDITKFIYSNKLFNSYGFIKNSLEISYEKIVEKIKETQEVLRELNQKENESVGNNVIYGEASINENEVEVNGESLEYDNLLISTGARPFIPDVPGAEHALTSKDMLNIDNVPEKLVIIGGGVIACEIANIYSTLGSEVTVLARSKFLKDIDDDQINEYILKNLIGDVNVLENVEIAEVKKNGVVTTSGEEFEGTPFFATGRVANSEIAEGFVEINDDKTIKVDEMMKTSRDNVYAAGDVTGGIQLTPIARKEGICAARNMANYPNKISYQKVPQSLSLNMEVSFVKDETAGGNDEFIDISIPGTIGPGAFWHLLSHDSGISKISFDENENKIRKITSISPSSVSDIAYLSYLMREDYDLNDYSDFIEIHPSTDANYKIIKNLWL